MKVLLEGEKKRPMALLSKGDEEDLVRVRIIDAIQLKTGAEENPAKDPAS